MNLFKQDVNKIVNKQDLALYLIAVAAHYREEHLEDMSKLAILAVKLSKNSGDFKSARYIKEAKGILGALAFKVTKDLPGNYSGVTVYPKSNNTTKLGMFNKHLIFFPIAKKKAEPTERSLLLMGVWH